MGALVAGAALLVDGTTLMRRLTATSRFVSQALGCGRSVDWKWLHEVNWDLVVFYEYHLEAWRETAKELFAGEDKTAFKKEATRPTLHQLA